MMLVVLLSIAVFNIQAVTKSAIYLVNIDAAIGPASYDYLKVSLEKANSKNAHLIIVKLDTPGGLASSMREMTQLILNSKAPVAVYVAPSGANAASAGAFLVYAAHVASMAPGTNIGAASPLPIGSDAPLPNTPSDGENGDSNADNLEDRSPVSTAQTKIIEDLTAYMRSLAEVNQRNAELGVEMITKGSSFSAQEALKNGIINFISTDIEALLKQLHGYKLTIAGKTVTLSTSGKQLIPLEPNWRYDFLSIITNPNVTYILLIAGIYGVLFELYSPGALFPGILGAICLILAGYGLHLLPLNYAGLFLLILGIVLIVAETLVTSYGLFGIGGFIAFIVGSVFLLDTLYPVYSVSKVIIGVMAVLSATILSIIANFVVNSLRQRQITGSGGMVGKSGVAITDFRETGQIECDGSVFTATAATPIKSRQKVIVTEVHGIKLVVKPKDKTDSL